MKISARIVNCGIGGFLNPPTHPEHTMGVNTYDRNGRNDGCMSLSSAIEPASSWLPEETRAQARKILADWKAPAIDSPEVQDWIRQVLGYFRNCYRPAGTVGRCAVDKLEIDERDPMVNIDHHAGVYFIRCFYPEFTPTVEHFTGAYWGSKPD